MATTKEELLVLGIKANGHYLGQVEASCLHVRQAAFIWGKLPSHAAAALA